MQSEENPLIVLPGPFGAPIEIKPSIVMLLVLLVFLSGARSPDAIVDVLIFAAMLVVSIMLHEWGHAWGSWVQGVPVRRVVLYGGGGLCYSGPSTRREDELITAMGPIVNLALWAVFSMISQHMVQVQLNAATPDPTMLRAASWLGFFAMLNLFLFFFNMVPIFPLDGGRLLFLTLLRFLPLRAAGIWAGRIGLVACVGYFLLMLWALVNLGWIFLFFPSFALHKAMAQGRVTP